MEKIGRHISELLALTRPRQWVKNLIVPLPLFFAGEIDNLPLLGVAAVLTVAFTLMSGAVYCINDLVDEKADRVHPVKRTRPIASGLVKRGEAMWMAALLSALALAMPLVAGTKVWRHTAWILAIYLLLNAAYCAGLKNVAILDLFIVAMGFVLRLLCGGYGCGIWLSPWIIVMIFLLSLFVAMAKRRDDVLILERHDVMVRKNVRGYNLTFLDSSLVLVGGITMVSYIIYTLSPEVEDRFDFHYMYGSAIFVLAGILRYMQLAMVEGRTGNPTEIVLGDRFIRICLLLWFLFFVIVRYIR